MPAEKPSARNDGFRSLSVARDYDSLHAALRARTDELNVSRHTIDEISGLPHGYTGKLLGGRQVKHFGAKSLGPYSRSWGSC